MNEQRKQKRLLLTVIDGLGYRALQRGIAEGHAPHLEALLKAGATLNRGISPFPSLTPVCLSTIATGSLPDQHRIPSLAWYQRGEHRFVEYGSSFAASGIESTIQTIEDVVLNLNLLHLAESPRTLFELCEDNGIPSASVNHLIFRGRQRHTMKHAWASEAGKRTSTYATYGPTYFWWGELFGTHYAAMPQFGLKRPRDWSASRIGRWVLRNTDAGFVLLYLGQHDSAAHKLGPIDATRALRVADRSLERVIAAMGGLDRFIEDFGLIVCADHGQTSVLPNHHFAPDSLFADFRLFTGRNSQGSIRVSARTDAGDAQLAIAPSNRVAMVYRLSDDAPDKAVIAERLLEAPAIDVAVWRDADVLHIQQEGKALRAQRGAPGDATSRQTAARVSRPSWLAKCEAASEWLLEGDLSTVDIRVEDGVVHYGSYPDCLDRADAITRCVNAGDVIASATVGWEFVDLGGNAHTGGSHGSLHEIDSTAPVITMGLVGDAATDIADAAPIRLADIAHLVADHFAIDYC